jgi:hypothetical protein
MSFDDALLTAVRMQMHDKHMQLHIRKVHVQYAALEGRGPVFPEHGERPRTHDAQVIRLPK